MAQLLNGGCSTLTAHSVELLDGFGNSYAMISRGPRTARTAAVFVHGFGGSAVTTWLELQTLVDELHEVYPDFAQWDLYFHQSYTAYGDVPVLAADIVSLLRAVFPSPRDGLLALPSWEGVPVREDPPALPERYERLVLVGIR
jgi:pimeloyl-ACP methyl ester carboxylesterase